MDPLDLEELTGSGEGEGTVGIGRRNDRKGPALIIHDIDVDLLMGLPSGTEEAHILTRCIVILVRLKPGRIHDGRIQSPASGIDATDDHHPFVEGGDGGLSLLVDECPIQNCRGRLGTPERPNIPIPPAVQWHPAEGHLFETEQEFGVRRQHHGTDFGGDRSEGLDLEGLHLVGREGGEAPFERVEYLRDGCRDDQSIGRQGLASLDQHAPIGESRRGMPPSGLDHPEHRPAVPGCGGNLHLCGCRGTEEELQAKGQHQDGGQEGQRLDDNRPVSPGASRWKQTLNRVFHVWAGASSRSCWDFLTTALGTPGRSERRRVPVHEERTASGIIAAPPLAGTGGSPEGRRLRVGRLPLRALRSRMQCDRECS